MEDKKRATTAAALIIGDEILSGKVHERNGYELAKVLFDRGVNLVRMEIVSDNIDDIAISLRTLSSRVDYVFTSGGIGPTHDDRTYEAVAKAFELTFKLHEPTVAQFYEFHRNSKKVMTAAHEKMALLPFPAEVLSVEGLWMPIVHVKNVYVLPGVPPLFDRILSSLSHRFSGLAKSRALIYTHKPETEIAEALENIQARYPAVAIGSYPQAMGHEFNVMVSVEGINHDDVEIVAAQVKNAIAGKELSK